MKKIIALLLVIISVLALVAVANADVKIKVLESAQFVYDTGKNDTYKVYMYGIVRNDGNEPVQIKSSTMNIINNDKKVIGDDISSLYVYPEYLDVGECGYYFKDVTLKDVKKPKQLVSHKIEWKTETRYMRSKRYAENVTIDAPINLKGDYYYIPMTAILTNDFEDIIEDPHFVYIVRDQKGKLLFIYHDKAGDTDLYPGSKVGLGLWPMPTDLTRVWVADKKEPTTFEIICYQQD